MSIKVNLPSGEFVMKFHHQQYKAKDGKMDDPITMVTPSGHTFFIRGVTTVELWDIQSNMVVAKASSYCSVYDVFNKAKGRLEALKKLISDFPDRNVRQEVFSAYIKSGARI